MNAITRQIVIEARKHLHVREVGRNDGPEVRTWLFRAGSKPGNPWCAAFASCVIEDACKALGMRTPIRLTAGVHRLIHDCRRNGAWGIDPGAGYLFAVDHGTGLNGVKRGHCGFVIDLCGDGKNMLTVEGNTDPSGGRDGQGVYQRVRRISEATLGFVDIGLLVSHG